MPELLLPEQINIKGLAGHKQVWVLGKAAFNGWLDDHAPSMGAALAYYTLFSIAPTQAGAGAQAAATHQPALTALAFNPWRRMRTSPIAKQ